MTRWNGKSNESTFEMCSMGTHPNGVNCGVVERVKKNTLRFFGHIEEMKSEEFVKSAHEHDCESNLRGKPLGRWKDRVKEYICENGATREGGLDQGRRECMDRERWRLFCCGHPVGGRFWSHQGIRATDR